MDGVVADTGRDRAAFTRHGGDLGAAARAFPRAPLPWIDLSTGINSRSYPLPRLAPAVWSALPDASAVLSLEAAAARAYGTLPARVAAAPGTEALIQWLPQLVRADTVGVLGFTYGDHARAWAAAGAAIDTVERVADLRGRDVAVVVNPNNPDGRVVPPRDLAGLAPHVGLLVVDEAFADCLPVGASLAPNVPDNAVVLRSFGKFYGLAGLRLGFAVGSEARAAALRAALGPWAVSGPAVAVGRQALGDDAWADRERARLAAAAERLDGLLARGGLDVVGGTSLFRLAETRDAAAMFELLAEAGILTRPFGERPRWLRFGLPTDAAAWARLEQIAIRWNHLIA